MSDRNRETHVVCIGNKVYHLVKRRDSAGMELVKAYPDDTLPKDVEAERIRAAEAYGEYRSSPRRDPPADIDRPVDQRTQTILSREVDADTRARLNGGFSSRSNRGRR